MGVPLTIHRLIPSHRHAFKKDVICVPLAMESTFVVWTTLKSCVWRAPNWFTYHTRLSAMKDYEGLYSLFTRALSVEDASYDHFLAYLRSIQDPNTFMISREEEERKIILLYKELGNEAKSLAIVKQIKY
jgi:hypothetical protein